MTRARSSRSGVRAPRSSARSADQPRGTRAVLPTAIEGRRRVRRSKRARVRLGALASGSRCCCGSCRGRPRARARSRRRGRRCDRANRVCPAGDRGLPRAALRAARRWSSATRRSHALRARRRLGRLDGCGALGRPRRPRAARRVHGATSAHAARGSWRRRTSRWSPPRRHGCCDLARTAPGSSRRRRGSTSAPRGRLSIRRASSPCAVSSAPATARTPPAVTTYHARRPDPDDVAAVRHAVAAPRRRSTSLRRADTRGAARARVAA